MDLELVLPWDLASSKSKIGYATEFTLGIKVVITKYVANEDAVQYINKSKFGVLGRGLHLLCIEEA